MSQSQVPANSGGRRCRHCGGRIQDIDGIYGCERCGMNEGPVTEVNLNYFFKLYWLIWWFLSLISLICFFNYCCLIWWIYGCERSGTKAEVNLFFYRFINYIDLFNYFFKLFLQIIFIFCFIFVFWGNMWGWRSCDWRKFILRTSIQFISFFILILFCYLVIFNYLFAYFIGSCSRSR